MGAVHITPGRFRHAEEVANLAAVAKHEAKQSSSGMVLHDAASRLTIGRALEDVLAA